MSQDSGTLDATGDISTETKQDDIITALAGVTVVSRTPSIFQDTNFVVGNSPAVLDVNTALGQNGREFSVINDGAGDFTVSISNDGAAFGDEYPMSNGDTYSVDNISVDSIRVTHVSDSSYRVIAL